MVQEIFPVETEPNHEEVLASLTEMIDEHVIDFPLEETGNKEKIGGIRSDAVGAIDVVVNRCDPQLEIPELRLQRGKSFVLIGPNGAGKSTVFDSIMDVRNASMNTQHGKGAVSYGESVHVRDSLRISRLNQEEILSELDDVPVDLIIEKVKEYFKYEFPVDWNDEDKFDDNMKNQEAQQRIDELSDQFTRLFEMEEFMNRRVDELSGGERTKLTLLMTLLSEPDVLLLDEPTNHLDLSSIAKLSGLFEAYKKSGVSILSVSHVDWFLQEAGNDGVIEIESDAKERKLNVYSSPYKKVIKNRARQEHHIVDEEISWMPHSKQTPDNLISTSQDEVTVKDSPLEDIHVETLNRGDVWVLGGNNGTGKTKLMESILTDRKTFNREKGATIAYLPQFWPEDIADGDLENFFYWLRDMANPGSQITSASFKRAIRDIGFNLEGKSMSTSNLLKQEVDSFSGGEQRLLWFIAVSCLENVDALFLDEPTNHMDQHLQGVITRAIQEFPGAVVFSTHDVNLLDSISNDIGNKIGGGLAPKNMVLTKTNGKTEISVSDEKPNEYMNRVFDEAQRQSGRISI
jgi:ATP-binding cassette, subfamily F, member 3